MAGMGTKLIILSECLAFNPTVFSDVVLRTIYLAYGILRCHCLEGLD